MTKRLLSGYNLHACSKHAALRVEKLLIGPDRNLFRPMRLTSSALAGCSYECSSSSGRVAQHRWCVLYHCKIATCMPILHRLRPPHTVP